MKFEDIGLNKRYSQRPFPPYRFFSGENPHPTESPLGHSFGKKDDEHAKILVPGEWQDREDYLFAVDLYNYVFWWESHEAFEGLWRQSPQNSPARNFFQGLIKISAAFLKWYGHKREPLEYLYAGGIGHLRLVLEKTTHYMGIDLMEHITHLSNHFRTVIADTNAWPDPLVNYPFILLEE